MKTTFNEKENLSTDTLLIGSGGINPGIFTYCTESGEVRKILELSLGNSIYSIEASKDKHTIVAGTKSGLLYRLIRSSQDGTEYHIDKFIQGCSILSVCMLDNYTIATSDISGRTLLWRPDISRNPQKLPTGNNIIVCSLFKAAKDRLAGITKNGKLLLWDINSSDIIDTLPIPKPPSMAALIRPLWWAKAGCWLWPGTDGVIVLFDPCGNKIHKFPAHHLGFYAICLCEDNIVSAGHKDGSLKLWQSGNNEPVAIFDIPKGIISAVCWPKDNSMKILLAKETGESEVYTYKQRQLEFSHTIPVRNCRSFAAVDLEAIKNRRQQRIKKEAEKLCLKITEHIANREYDQLDKLYEKVEALGFEKASLFLKAKEAREKTDIVSEINAHVKLSKISEVSPETLPKVFERYAELLKKTWSLQQALSIYTQLSKIYGQRKYQKDIRRLTNYVQIMQNKQYVIEPDIAPIILAKAKNLFNQPLTGKVVIRKISSARLNSRIVFREFADSYKKLDIQNTASPAPEVIEQIQWLLEDQGTLSDVVLFSDSSNNQLNGVELCLRFINSGIETTAMTSIVLDFGKLSYDFREIDEKIRLIEDTPDAIGLFRSVHERINFVVRQLITKKLAQKKALMRSY